MIATPVIAIFDVGKTNKKLLLFDQAYQLVWEESAKLPEITDEDGFPCEDVQALTLWVKESFDRLLRNKNYEIRAVNFSGYGASFVHIDEDNHLCAPLYNYLKPFPEELQSTFYHDYGGQAGFSAVTASPVLGNLNSGMQLYWLLHHRPETFARIKYSLHLPQYLSFILSSNPFSELTSIGCHTNLWNFQTGAYHQWVSDTGIDKKLPPITSSDSVVELAVANGNVKIGVGLHDSSAALIPYLESFEEPFVLISTGTWCISLNPFNNEPLTDEELKADCLCYLSFKGEPVKASRLFAGNEHEQRVKKLAEKFDKPESFYSTVSYRPELFSELINGVSYESEFWVGNDEREMIQPNEYATYEEAYHQLMFRIILQQKVSTNLVIKKNWCEKNLCGRWL